MANSYPRSGRDFEQNDPYRGDYRSGYEPSAPPYHHERPKQFQSSSAPPPGASSPYDDFDEFPRSRGRGDFSHPENSGEPREPVLGPAEKNESLGGYLFRGLVRPLWGGSRSILRIDLRRSLGYDGPVLNKGRRHRSAPEGAVASAGGRDYFDDEEIQGSRGWLNGITGGGARLKLMQVWDAPPDFLGEIGRKWNMTMGFGLNLELDKGHLQPKFRFRTKHIALHVLPQPELELCGKWPVMNTRLAVNVKYRIPLTMGLEDMWNSSGTRLMVNFFNPLGSGFRLTTGGAEFDGHLIQLQEHTKLRCAATLSFPRKLPLEEGEQPVKIRVHRLGLKTVVKPGWTI